MVFAAMLLMVVVEDIIQEPLIGFGLVLRLVKVIEDFVGFFDCPEGTLNLPF